MSTDKAADRPSVTDNARAELRRDLLADYDPTPGLIARGVIPDPDDDVHHECGRPWADHTDDGVQMLCPDPTEATTATTEDAEEVLHGAGWFARADLDPRDLHGILHDLADAGLLATARTRPTREEVATAVGAVLFNAMNHPNPAAVLGKSMTPLRAKVTDAVMALLDGGER